MALLRFKRRQKITRMSISVDVEEIESIKPTLFALYRDCKTAKSNKSMAFPLYRSLLYLVKQIMTQILVKKKYILDIHMSFNTL